MLKKGESMILYVDDEHKIKAVNSTTDDTLTPIYVDENHELFPFKGWSTAKICCYKVEVYGGVVTMMTPYVDSRLLEGIDTIGGLIDSVTPYKAKKTAYIDDTQVVFKDVPSGTYDVKFNKSVLVKDIYQEGYTDGTSTIIVSFEPLEEVTEATLTIS